MTPPENEALRQENETLRRRLAEAEQVNEALTKGEIDAVVDAAYQVPLLLRQAQDALRESEERYRGLFENMVEGYAHCRMVLDHSEPRDFVYLDVNKAFEQLTGLHDVVGKPVTEVLPGIRESNPELIQIYGRVALTGNPEAFETYLPSLGIWFAITVYSSKKMHFIAVFRDITERKAAAERLRESEERYRVLFDGSPLPMWLVDQETLAIAAVNEAAVLHYGYSREEFLSKTLREIWHPDEVGAATARLAESSGDPWSGVRRHFRKGGASITVEVFSHTVQLAGRRYRLSVVRDINDLKRVEAQRERLAAIVEASPDFIGVADPKTTQIQYINKHGRKMCGLGEDEDVRKLKIGDVHPAWMNKRMVEVILPATMRDGIWEGEGAFLHRNGREIPVLMALLSGKAANGEVEVFYTVSRDITEMKRLEAQFLQSQKMEAVGRLAGGVAHDFNNLLTVMLGYSAILLQGLAPGPLQEATDEIRRAGERAAALTRQLLAFSRKQTLVPEVLDMGDVLSGLSTMVERLIGEEVKVSVVVSPNLGRVKADRGQLEQVVMNIAVNARDAMPKGGSLTFELQNVELDDAYTATHAKIERGPYVLLAVSDTGTGMDAETQRRIFEPFFTTKEAGKGTGLGLSTVYGIVHQSGGAIEVYSEPGRGTTFKVYLPRIAGDAAVPRPASGIRPALPTGSETVLVVEDEAAIRQLTKLLLQRAGYTVLLAETPVTAERIAGSHPGPIHLLLTDVVMPGMRGPELAKRLISLRPDLRVLYMSGYTDDAIAHHGFLDAGLEFLQKPFTPLGLMQKIRDVLDAAAERPA